MGTMLKDPVSEDSAPHLEPAEIECAVCGMPSLTLPMQHTLGCPRHDPATCHACSAP
jgi:hypothetical protein